MKRVSLSLFTAALLAGVACADEVPEVGPDPQELLKTGSYKRTLEEPVKSALARGLSEVPLLLGSRESRIVRPQRVAPGKVRWHPSYAAALRAAKTSGKPVLLFQLLGRLDEAFC